MLKSIIPAVGFVFFLSLAWLAGGESALAVSCNACVSDCNGKILMVNADTGRTLSADVKALVAKGRALGLEPASCVRPQRCQDQLVQCFNACGQAGRAVRHSKHAEGAACDWSGSGGQVIKRLFPEFPNMRELRHVEAGAGVHDFTTRYVASNGAVSPPEPPPRPIPGQAPGQFPNGRYKCPSGLRSICGSTKNTPWCQEWLRSGHTPGCFN